MSFEVVYPARTVLAENPVSVVDKVVDKKGTRKPAEAYLAWLYSDEGQELAARHGLRPRNAKVLAAHAKSFPAVATFTVDEVYGSWKQAQKTHFDDGGIFDEILAATKRQ
jgi:sulfate transport system substrate-binding protein